MSEAQPTSPEVTVKLNTFSLPLAFLLMDGKYKPDGLGLSGFLGYVSKVGPEKATRVFDPMSITAAGGFVIRWLHGSDASLPYRHWSDRMALTAAWVIEHGGYFGRPTPVQNAIVFREGRPAWSDWRIDPDGDHLAIQVIRGPRKIDSYRWRICDGMVIADSGSEFRNQHLRLPDLSSHVGPGVPPRRWPCSARWTPRASSRWRWVRAGDRWWLPLLKEVPMPKVSLTVEVPEFTEEELRSAVLAAVVRYIKNRIVVRVSEKQADEVEVNDETATNEPDTVTNKPDTVSGFLAACTMIDIEGKVPARTLYTAYQRWCRAQRFDPLTENMVGRKLRKLGFDEKRTAKGMLRCGLVLCDSTTKGS